MKATVTVATRKTIEIPDIQPEVAQAIINSPEPRAIEAMFYRIVHRSSAIDRAELRLGVIDPTKHWTERHCKNDFFPDRVYASLESADDMEVFERWVDYQRELYPDLKIEDNRDDVQLDD